MPRTDPASSAADRRPLTREGMKRNMMQAGQYLELCRLTPAELLTVSRDVQICTARGAQLHCADDEGADTRGHCVLLVPTPSAWTVVRVSTDEPSNATYIDVTSGTRDRYSVITTSLEAVWWPEMGDFCVLIQQIWRNTSADVHQLVGNTFHVWTRSELATVAPHLAGALTYQVGCCLSAQHA